MKFKTLEIYKLTSENLTNLGGPMGSEYTFSNWEKYFTSIESAKKYAEKDYGDKIKWKGGKRKPSSGDLRYVMYEIEKLNVIE